MITGVILYENGTLVVEFPCKAYDLASHLGSIGVRTPASELSVHGTEQIEVKLAANEPVGELILSKIRDGDTLSGVNLACQEVSRVCPFGYEEFLDMLGERPKEPYNRYAFYKSFETLPPSTAEGVKFILEETRRYRTTMENYALVCKAAEDEEYSQPEGEDLER